MSTEFDWFVGIDWATQAHEVCILDASGTVVQRHSVPHSGDGLKDLVARLVRLCGGLIDRVAVGIEVPHGAVVETLLERGFAVFSVNPKQLDRFRDRFSPAGAKDDRLDARVIGDSLRTDRRCFRRLAAQPTQIIRLRELVRAEAELKEELQRFSNRLRDLLHRYYPQVLALSPAADEPWLWDLLHRAPTPAKGRRLHQATLEQLLRRHRIRRIVAHDLRQALCETPLQLAPGTVEAVSDRVGSLVPRLQLAHRQLGQLQQRIEALLEELAEPAESATDDADGQTREHRDVEILLSAPGVGRVTVATMLAQANQAIQDRDYHIIRAQSGLAPITKASGQSRRVQMRYACDERLRNAFYHMARVASICDESARCYYQELRGRGHSHGRALRAVADRQLRILMAMLREGTLYDPQRCLRPSSVPTKVA